MELHFRLSKDAEYIAGMNKAAQELHYTLYPEYFKPFSYNETAEFLKNQLQEEHWFCFIASYDGKDVGYALFYIRDYQENPFRKAYRGVHIEQISILPAYKRKGLGRGLMREIEKFALQEKASQIELTRWELNKDAKSFYDAIGFETYMRFLVKKLGN